MCGHGWVVQKLRGGAYMDEAGNQCHVFCFAPASVNERALPYHILPAVVFYRTRIHDIMGLNYGAVKCPFLSHLFQVFCPSKKKLTSTTAHNVKHSSKILELCHQQLIFQRTWFDSQCLHSGSHLSVSPVSGDLTPTSCLHWYCTHVVTDMHVGTQSYI